MSKLPLTNGPEVYQETQFIDVRREDPCSSKTAIAAQDFATRQVKEEFAKSRSNFFEVQDSENVKMTNQCWQTDRSRVKLGTLL